MLRVTLFFRMLFFVFFVHMVLQPVLAVAENEVVSEKSPLYQELMPAAIEWKNAVLKKQVEVLVSYVLPEARKKVASDLKNSNSDLYGIFYKGKNSIYDRLSKAKRLKIVLVKKKELEGFGQGTDVYYYDEDKIKLQFPLSDKKVQSLLREGKIVLMFFFKEEGRWFTSYEFFDNNGDVNKKTN